MKLWIPLLLGFSLSALAAPLTTFTTDYCTSFPEGTRKQPQLWRHCCLEHDLFFWAGGSRTQRDEADLTLKACVEETGETAMARVIYLGVRSGRLSPVKLPGKHWGNGWSSRSQYRQLSQDDLDLIEEELLQGHDYISIDLKESFLHKLRSRMD